MVEELLVRFVLNGNIAHGALCGPDKRGEYHTARITSAPDAEQRAYLLNAFIGMAPVLAFPLVPSDAPGKIFRFGPPRVWVAIDREPFCVGDLE